MSDIQRPDDTIPHQDLVEDVIDAELVTASDHAAIADLAAITGGESPTEAEHNLVVGKVNEILDVLRDSGLIPSA